MLEVFWNDLVNVNALELLSTIILDWHVSILVPETTDKGDVGGVKPVVYRAVPLTIRTFEIYPWKNSEPTLLILHDAVLEVIELAPGVTGVPLLTPSTYRFVVVPFLTAAT